MNAAPMRSLLSLLRLDFLPKSADLGLLVLRLWFGLSMLLLHGLAKAQNFEKMAAQFPPWFGLSPTVNLGLAILAELVCSALLVLGLFTRGASLVLAFTMAMAFFRAHGGKLTGEGNGEMAFLYLGVYLVLFIAGPGRISLDGAGRSRDTVNGSGRY